MTTNDQSQDANTVQIMALLQGNSNTRSEIIERCRANPLEVSEGIRGNGEGEVGYALDLGRNSVKGTVRVVVSGKITCDSNPEKQFGAMDHMKAFVKSALAEELTLVQGLMEKVNGEEA